MANFEKDFDEKLNKLGYSITYYDEYGRDLEDESPVTTSLYVGLHVLNGSIEDFQNNIGLESEIIGKSIRIPKKKTVTIDYFLKKINNECVYKNFVEDFKNILSLKGYTNGISVYPTSYGIGIFVLFGNMENAKKNIEEILNEYNIDFKTEYSNARYVFRYKISKKKENIEKFKNLK